EPLGEVERRGPAHIVAQGVVEFGFESGIDLRPLILGGQLEEIGHQCLGHEHAAVAAEVAGGVGKRSSVDHGSGDATGKRCARKWASVSGSGGSASAPG